MDDYQIRLDYYKRKHLSLLYRKKETVPRTIETEKGNRTTNKENENRD